MSLDSTEKPREDIARKRAGQSCITFFVVFLISLVSFGKSVLIKTAGGRIQYNLISCLGIAMGMVAFLYLLFRFKAILKLSVTKKVLGLIGCFGLIVHSLFALFLPLNFMVFRFGSFPPAGSMGFTPMAQSGAETWMIDEKQHVISSSYYLLLPDSLQYTIEYPYSFENHEEEMDDDTALDIAFPLMKYAYTHESYKRATITKAGKGVVNPTKIGVCLVENRNGNVRGYRTALSMKQIQKRIKKEEASSQNP